MENYIHILNNVGEVIDNVSKMGGGCYVVIGHKNCNRCDTLIEEREVLRPNKKQRKNGSYYSQYSWCYKCGLYESKQDTRVILSK